MNLDNYRKKALSDFYWFAKHVCGFRDMEDQPHRLICDFLSRPDPLKMDKKRSIILVARGHLKSTVISAAYPLWRLAQDPYESDLIISYTHDRAKGFLRQIKTIIETPDKDYRVQGIPSVKLFQTLFYDWSLAKQIREKWSDDALQIIDWRTVTDTCSGKLIPYNIGGYSIEAIGVGQQLASRHPKRAIMDDMVDEETAKSQVCRQNAIEYILYVEPLVSPGGEVVVTGTFYDPEDAYHYIKEKVGNQWNILHIPVSTDWGPVEVKPPMVFNAWEGPAWPKRFTPEVIKNLEIAMDYPNSELFALQYGLCSRSEKTAHFKREWVRLYYLHDIYDEKQRKYLRNHWVTMAVDLNAEGVFKRDNAAITVVLTDCNNLWYVLEARAGQWNFDETEDQIIDVYLKWPEIMVIGVEANRWQKLFSRTMQGTAWRRKLPPLPIHKIDRKTTQSKDDRIRGLIPKAKAREILYPAVLGPNNELVCTCPQLITEEVNWRPKMKNRDDLLETLVDHLHPEMSHRPPFDGAPIPAHEPVWTLDQLARREFQQATRTGLGAMVEDEWDEPVLFV